MPDAGTVTLTEQKTGTVKKVKFTWVSDAAGASDKQTAEVYSGAVQRVVTIPDGGATQPTNLYDVTLLDDDGVDVCFGNAANRSNVTTEQILPANLGHIANSKLYLHVTNAGNAKGGVLIAYLR